MNRTIITLSCIFIFSLCSNATTKNKSKIDMKNLYLIETNFGNITISLYDETPIHKANFDKLCNEKKYDGVIFHRIIKDFMVQGGDVTSKNPEAGKQYGSGDVGYTLQAEIFPDKFIHKKGAIAAARTGDEVNPERRSSGCQFYIVEGKPCDSTELSQMEISVNKQIVQSYGFKMYKKEQEIAAAENKEFNHEEAIEKINKYIQNNFESIASFKYTPEQRKIYETIGGTPFLDGSYTVFGEVTEGLDVIEKIAAVKTLSGDRPEEDIIIKQIKKL